MAKTLLTGPANELERLWSADVDGAGSVVAVVGQVVMDRGVVSLSASRLVIGGISVVNQRA